MATITEKQRKANQEIINQLMKVLGIDNIENIKDFSIHVRQNDVIQTEVSFFNTEFQIEKIMKVFDSKGEVLSEEQKKLDEKLGRFIEAKGEAIDTEWNVMDRMNKPAERDTYSKWRTIEPGKVYNDVYLESHEFTYQKEGIAIKCSGVIISEAPILTELGEDDLILKDLKGIKKIEPYYPHRPDIKGNGVKVDKVEDRIIPNVGTSIFRI